MGVDELQGLVRGWAREHRSYWRKAACVPGAEIGLVTGALGRLEALSLVRRDTAGVRPLPALARYAVAEPTLVGLTAPEAR